MKLGRWGWGLKRLSHARFQRNLAMGFGDSEKKYVAEALFFCDVYDAPLLPLSLDRFPTNFPRTRVQVVARDTWFHIPEKFPLRNRIFRKTVFLGYFTGHRKRSATATLFPSITWWTSHRYALPRWLLLSDVPFSTSERLAVPQYQ